MVMGRLRLVASRWLVPFQPAQFPRYRRDLRLFVKISRNEYVSTAVGGGVKQWQNKETPVANPSGERCRGGGVGASIAGGSLLLLWDAAVFGSFGASLLVCPVWFLASILKNASARAGWRLVFARMAIPP